MSNGTPEATSDYRPLMRNHVTVPCGLCGAEDLAPVQTTPWDRFCPVCKTVTTIVSGQAIAWRR